jgi:hypothetical protein
MYKTFRGRNEMTQWASIALITPTAHIIMPSIIGIKAAR